MKKVVLTEAQLNQIIMLEQYENAILLELNESKNLQDIKKKLKRAFLTGITVAAILGAVSRMDISNSQKQELKQFVNTELVDDTAKTENDTLQQQKIEACRAYMEWAMKNQGYDWSTTKLTPEAIVDACEKNDFSIPFVLAVANLESCFGQTPRAQRTNSIFSVGSYDDGRDVCKFSTPNESIEHFIKLIKKDYLLNGKKRISDLLAPNNFVNMNGNRYAKNPKYEGQVKSIMNRIIKMYPILAGN
jgi:gas vesicle protein